jgi:hypothetical protein
LKRNATDRIWANRLVEAVLAPFPTTTTKGDEPSFTYPPPMPSSVQKGDDYIHTLALYIQANSRALASSPFPSSRPRPSSSSQQPLTSSLYSPFASLAALTLSSSSSPSTNAPKPLTLRLTPQTLFYLLLRFQASSIGTVSSVGRLDVPLGDETKRAMSFAEPSEEERRKRARERDRAETGSFRSALSVVSSTMSLGGWWGTSKAAVDPGQSSKSLCIGLERVVALRCLDRSNTWLLSLFPSRGLLD